MRVMRTWAVAVPVLLGGAGFAAADDAPSYTKDVKPFPAIRQSRRSARGRAG